MNTESLHDHDFALLTQIALLHHCVLNRPPSACLSQKKKFSCDCSSQLPAARIFAKDQVPWQNFARAFHQFGIYFVISSKQHSQIDNSSLAMTLDPQLHALNGFQGEQAGLLARYQLVLKD